MQQINIFLKFMIKELNQDQSCANRKPKPKKDFKPKIEKNQTFFKNAFKFQNDPIFLFFF